MKIQILVAFLIIASLSSKAQHEKPKLIIGIVVDQMRYDYLNKFYHNYSDDGFKKLLDSGFSCHNINYNYKPTYTGPGHASIFTGVTPNIHGIIANHWYDKFSQREIYCVSVYDSNGNVYNSPERLLSETFSDGMKQFMNYQSKVYGISMKDRGAILPVGHLADGAFWFNSVSGQWESNTYYPNSFALDGFNKTDFKRYINQDWKLSLPIEQYAISLPDNLEYKYPLSQSTKAKIPYDLKSIFNEIGWGVLKTIPQGNQMTADAAKFLIASENLGKDAVTDFLAISFSATDYIGHRFGVQSIEIHDTYIKLDETIADLLNYLESKVGKENFVLFLTSDHGAALPISYLKDKRLPGGKIDEYGIKRELKKKVEQQTGNENWVSDFINLNLYLNDSLRKAEPVTYERVKKIAIDFLNLQAGIADVLDLENLHYSPSSIDEKIILGSKINFSGDLICMEEPNWSTYTLKGSSHGSAYAYDTHVPLIFYGLNVSHGGTQQPYSITSIIPTLSVITGIPFENSQTDEVIIEMVK